MTLTTVNSPALETYISAVRSAVDARVGADETVRRVVAANEVLRSAPFEIPAPLRRIKPGVAYTRNLVHQDLERGFSVIAILWGRFQETRVHDHLNWCVMHMLEGSCMAIDYERLDDEKIPGRAELAIRAAGVLETGGISGLTPPPRSNIHKIANARPEVSISLHTYGDPGTRARVFDPVAGKVEIVDLAFHNLEP